VFPKTNQLALDLLDKMLEFNPTKRVSVEEALKHPYLARLHHPASETVCKAAFDFEFEKVDMTKHVLREFMWEEILHYRPDTRAKRDRWLVHERERQKQAAAKKPAAAAPGAATTTAATTAPTAQPNAPKS